MVVLVGGGIGLFFALRGDDSSSKGASSADCQSIVSRLGQALKDSIATAAPSTAPSNPRITYLGTGSMPAGVPTPAATLSAACKIDEGGQGQGVVAKYQGADEHTYAAVLTSSNWTSEGS
ncbi:MAG: hypothetical protein ABI232_09620 [Jatrophihabitantaceae bacterium]